ncbi:DNA gyrase subunit A [Peptostreptococcus porci]|uniref:DNA gyrase subunit A n=2 Tax=Peptostreptococcus porci TaxID=2652282 RepID=UPI0023F33167|nr:DNA gyrase subunit A [Peptostreptococcus porci]MDD7182112.1 DNA gyrase subunit A [Peptostreptococcus porci]MDY5436278.1 DNA gyrase subunit A [Peptostreptococcus porci]
MEENKRIILREIADEMKNSYIDYSMSVIAGRALPDVRDGLKPVHRRILYSMSEQGITPDKPYRKSARIVGDVLGKYHPHGDISVYMAMVKMAQDFSTRGLLVDGQGNFGTVDGDSPAAMRYTEARMSKLALELLRDIDKETVDFGPNFDESLKEPLVLPARYPNLLVNGSNGIAVGMATSIPPHNLGEVIDATIHYIDNRDCSVDELLKYVKGPDFPTAATIVGTEGIKEAYKTGRGKVKVRAKAEIEELPKGRQQIVITEIPYQVNKARLVERIAELVKEKKVEGISDLRDESNRHGMRIVIELKRDTNANIVLNNIYKHSQLEDTFSIIMLSLVNGTPRILNLKEVIHYYVEHQREVITRRTQFELDKANARAHILEGLRIALDNIDRVINIIRSSANGQIAKEKLIEEFAFSDIQAQAILDMRLQRLTGLEREKIDNEYNELMKKIEYLESLLADELKLFGVIKDEMTAIKDKHADERRTEIIPAEGEFDVKDLFEEEDIVVTLTHLGYIKRLPADTYRSQKRGGRGISALTTREEDFITDLITTTNHSRMLFLTNRGRVYKLNAYEIPEGKRTSKGTAIVNLLQLNPGEKIARIITFNPDSVKDDYKYLLMVTKNGIVKKTPIDEFKNINKSGIIAIGLKDGDELIGVKMTDGDEEIMLVTQNAMSIKFNEKDIRPMGRTATGVKGITLSKDDMVVSMDLASEGSDLLVVSEKGYGKRTDLEEYRIQMRAGKGIKTYNINAKTGKLIGATIVNEDDEMMMINSDGVLIRIRVNEISIFGRITSGVKLMRTDEEVEVVSIAKIKNEDDIVE